MLDEAFVSRFIETIYDAALDPTLWPRVMEATAGFVCGPAAALVLHDALDRSGQFSFAWGDDPHYTKLYFDEYIKIHPLLPQMMFRPVGEIYAIGDIMPYDEFYASRFYNEWAKPQGYYDATSVMVEKSGTWIAHLTVPRHISNGRVDAEARRRMALIAPHFRRAVVIGKVLDMNKLAAASLADTLDGLAAAVLLVDAGGHIALANRAANRLLSEGTMLRDMHGNLALSDTQADRSLRDALSPGEDSAIGAKGIALPLCDMDGARWLAHVLPLTSGARQGSGVAYSAVAAVFVHKAALDLVSPWESMARQYQLTPGELRVLHAIAQVEGVGAAAAALGISEATVKTHLQNLFEKTATARQTELVKLVAAHASPLAN